MIKVTVEALNWAYYDLLQIWSDSTPKLCNTILHSEAHYTNTPEEDSEYVIYAITKHLSILLRCLAKEMEEELDIPVEIAYRAIAFHASQRFEQSRIDNEH